jgi:SWIM zinc finger
MATDTHRYAYRTASTLDAGRLTLQTSGGISGLERPAHPRFFTGFLPSAHQAATGLLVLADIARTDFRRAGRPLDGSLRGFRDPIVTCGGARLRFEAFSACCGAYARLDVLDTGLDGEVVAHGTTNVDVNPPLYAALTRVGGGDPLRVSVGPDDLTVGTLDGAVVEKKVPLPERWLRGLAEVPAVAAGFDARARLTAAEAAAFLGRLPAGAPREVRWLVPVGRSLRSSMAPVPGAVCLATPGRLGVLRPLLPFARALQIYGPKVGPDSGPVASGWELDLGGMRFTLLLSPGTDRGFSGEGGLLHALSAEGAADDADLLAPWLTWDEVVDVDALADRSTLPLARVGSALAVLATSGRVGFDAAELAYFHRVLPFDPGRVEQLSPRLSAARALHAGGQVRATGDGYEVRSGEKTYLVHRTAAGRWGCTCPWWAEHHGGRGPCKHVLAATLTIPSLVDSAR